MAANRETVQNFSCIDFESACLNLTEHDVAIRENVQNFAKLNLDFFVSVKQDEKKRDIVMASSRWPPFAKFCKNEFRLFCKRQQEEKKRCFMMANSQWPPLAKFCENKFRLFCKRQAGRKKTRLHDGEFAMATIREILQKLISTFL